MQKVALLSPEKDSLLSAILAYELGHSIKVIAYLQSINPDSFMLQSAGHEAIYNICDSLQTSLYLSVNKGRTT